MKKLLSLLSAALILLSSAAPVDNLQQFEGIFQKNDNRDAYVQFTVKNGVLIGKSLWDGREYEMVRQSDLEFVSKNEEHPAKFIRNESGEVTKVVLMNRSEWTKVKDYQAPKAVQLLPEQLQAFEGKYSFQRDKNLYLQIIAKENALVLKQMWDNKEIVLMAKGELSFFGKEQYFPAEFSKNSEGKIVQLTCFKEDLWDKVE